MLWPPEQTDEARDALLKRERSAVDDWVGILCLVRPELTDAEARVLTYGAIGMMNAHWRTATDVGPVRSLALLRGVVRNALHGAG